MILLPFALSTVQDVALAMRADDRREIFATRRSEDPTEVARDCVNYSRFGFVAACDDGVPAAAMGAAEVWPGMFSAWMFATDRWPEIARAATRHALATLVPQIITAGAHRLECRSIAGHDTAHRWLEYLGARREAVLRRFGKGAEDFYVYAWRLEDVHVFAAKAERAATRAANAAAA